MDSSTAGKERAHSGERAASFEGTWPASSQHPIWQPSSQSASMAASQPASSPSCLCHPIGMEVSLSVTLAALPVDSSGSAHLGTIPGVTERAARGLDQKNWFAISELAGAKPIYDFSSELPGRGAKLASAHLERAKCLLHSGSMHSGDYCDGAAAVMVRFGAPVGTKHKGLWVSEGKCAPQPLYYLRFVWPAGGVSPDEDGWAANKGTERQNRGMEQRLAPAEMVAKI
ncbi:unnamed protein product [Pleuronectes platessa]|uniref:Uncharacterized protein n=1 Tax=Pleuronectes platessa TaxID=8262 RepID=A0A9N7TN23_PLEPL|nr:unnamed protein product [Pleuronectes platessa]